MLIEILKQELDQLNENQLQQIVDFVNSLKAQTQQPRSQPACFWQQATPEERSNEFQAWVAQLPVTHVTLTDEAFDRNTLYE